MSSLVEFYNLNNNYDFLWVLYQKANRLLLIIKRQAFSNLCCNSIIFNLEFPIVQSQINPRGSNYQLLLWRNVRTPLLLPSRKSKFRLYFIGPSF